MKKYVALPLVLIFSLLFIGASEAEYSDQSVVECPYINELHQKSAKSECPFMEKNINQKEGKISKPEGECPFSGKSKSNNEKQVTSSKRLRST